MRPGVDDVLHDHDVTAGERHVDVLEEAHAAVATARVGLELDEVERVRDRHGAREVGEEHDARLQRRDQERVEALVVGGELGAELGDASGDLGPRQVDVADLTVLGCDRRRHRYEARRSR